MGAAQPSRGLLDARPTRWAMCHVRPAGLAGSHRRAMATARVVVVVVLGATAVGLALGYRDAIEQARAARCEATWLVRVARGEAAAAQTESSHARERADGVIASLGRIAALVADQPCRDDDPSSASVGMVVRDELRSASSTLRMQLAGSDAASSPSPRDLARTWGILGDLARAVGDSRDALEDYRRALDLRERQLRDDPGDVTGRLELGRDLRRVVAVLHADLARRREAQDACRRAIELGEELADADPDSVPIAAFLEGCWADLDAARARAGCRRRVAGTGCGGRDPSRGSAIDYRAVDHRPVTALGLHERTRATIDRLAEADPDDPDMLRAQSAHRLRLAAALIRLGRPDEALASYEAGRAGWDRVAAHGRDADRAAGRLADLDNRVGKIYQAWGCTPAALASLERAIAVLEATARPDQPRAWAEAMVDYLLQRAILLGKLGRSREAIVGFERARLMAEYRDGAGDYAFGPPPTRECRAGAGPAD